MYDFFLQTVFMASLAGVVYLISRGVPRISESEESKSSFFSKSFSSPIFLEKVDGFISSLLEKILRKLKVFLMRVDNVISGYINKVKLSSPVSPEENNRLLLSGEETGGEKTGSGADNGGKGETIQ